MVPRMARNDFDFFHGSWHVEHKQRTGGEEWIEYSGGCVARDLAGGIGFVDEMTFPTGNTGSTIALYEPGEDRWAHYWVSSRDGVMQPAVYGTRTGPTAEFFGSDTHEGRPIRVRSVWQIDSPDRFTWEQSFSDDDGSTWETNWVMLFSRR